MKGDSKLEQVIKLNIETLLSNPQAPNKENWLLVWQLCQRLFFREESEEEENIPETYNNVSPPGKVLQFRN